MTVALICHRCGEEWGCDPALAVPCPECRAPSGACCTRPHLSLAPHRARYTAAILAGSMTPCAALTWDNNHVTERLRPVVAVPMIFANLAWKDAADD